VGVGALAASIINVTIGGSIFVLPGTLAASMGSAAPLAFVLGAFLFVPITACYAAAGSRVSTTGGPYGYVAAAFGSFPGFLVAALLWISNVAGSGGLAAALCDQIAHLLPVFAHPASRAALLLIVYGGLVVLNSRGIRIGAVAIIAFAFAKALPLLALILAASVRVDVDYLRIAALPTWSAIGSSLVLVVFAYSGIETALAPSGEVNRPDRVVPRAVLAGVSLVIVLYVGLQVVAQGVLGPTLVGDAAPLADVADRIWAGSSRLMILTASISVVGVLQGDLLGSSRLLYALGVDGFLPELLGTVTRRHQVPVIAVVVHAFVAWLLAVAGSFATLALIAGGAFCVVYIASCAAAWQLQRARTSDTAAPMNLRGGALIPGVAILGLLLILSTLRGPEWLAIGAASMGVAAIYGGAQCHRRHLLLLAGRKLRVDDVKIRR
jgi:amino acid transporter